MGSIGEEELDQMIRDYIELADSPSTTSLKSSKSAFLNHQSTCLTLQEVLGKHTDTEVEIQEKISIYLKSNMASVGDTRSQIKWLVMKLMMDGYEASLCKTTWDYSTFSCPRVFQSTGTYEFIEVAIVDKSPNGEKPTRLIVDIEFRSQFEVARPTRTYKELINTLPIVYVGTEEKLNKILSLLCPAGKQSLKEKGLHIPPWRSATYMQSKWLSQDCKKVSFSSNNELGMDQNEEKSTTAKCCPFLF